MHDYQERNFQTMEFDWLGRPRNMVIWKSHSIQNNFSIESTFCGYCDILRRNHHQTVFYNPSSVMEIVEKLEGIQKLRYREWSQVHRSDCHEFESLFILWVRRYSLHCNQGSPFCWDAEAAGPAMLGQNLSKISASQPNLSKISASDQKSSL